jgi:hypothetical protein
MSPVPTWPDGPSAGRVTLAAALAWLAWGEPMRSLTPTPLTPTDAESLGSWQVALERYRSEEAQRSGELILAGRPLLLRIADFKPNGQRLIGGTPGKEATVATPKRISMDRFDHESSLPPEWLLVRLGPWLRLPEDQDGQVIYGNITLDRAAVISAFTGCKAAGSPARGRRSKYNWNSALEPVRAYLYANGAPKKGDGKQACLERLVSGYFRDNPPAESVVRERVARVISTFHAAMTPKA